MTALRANVLLLLAAFFWGAGNVAQKTVLDDVGPLTAVGLRCLIGAVAILPFVRRDLAGLRHVTRWEWRGLAVVALLFAAAITAQQASYGGTSVTNASFLVSMTTVLTPIVAWIVLGDRPHAILWSAVAAALAGAFLMGGASLTTMAAGDLGCLLSALLYSVWFVALGTVVTKTRRPGLLTLAQFVLTGTICLGLGIALEPISPARLVAALPELLILGVFATGLAFGLQAVAQQFTSASTAAILTSAESVFGAIGGALMLGERLSTATALGATLVGLAILAAQLTPAHPGP